MDAGCNKERVAESSKQSAKDTLGADDDDVSEETFDAVCADSNISTFLVVHAKIASTDPTDTVKHTKVSKAPRNPRKYMR